MISPQRALWFKRAQIFAQSQSIQAETALSDTPLHYRTITELAALLRSGDITPTGLTQHLIERIEALNGPLNAFNLVTADRALAEAVAAETLLTAGRDLGPLHGIPYAVKDLFDVVGLPTSAGSRTVDTGRKTVESEVTRRLAAAGMVILGKTITVEFAKGIVGINNIQGTPHNPWRETHCVPGGSSAGTAVAVAAGMAPMGLGTDTGGSVRAPAGLCGTVGLKTTVGRISRFGVFPLSWTLDSVGPLTRSVEDAALIHQIMQGEDARDDSTLGIQPEDVLSSLKSGVKGLRVGIPEDAFCDMLNPEVSKAIEAAVDVFRDMGAHVETITYPEAKQAAALPPAVNGAEAAVIHEARIDTKLDLMDPMVGPRMINDRKHLAIDYLKTLQAINRLRESQKESLRDIDVVLSATTPIPAAPVDLVNDSLEVYMEYAQQYMAYTNIGNRLGLCGLSLPCGFSSEGLPIGLLINGKPFTEAMVLRAGYAYEQATDWKNKRPNLDWAER
ncbi:MAG: amidase [Rhodospirillaceae bacterium]|nr:amidase [Rhodospirillaceae bacterium]